LALGLLDQVSAGKAGDHFQLGAALEFEQRLRSSQLASRSAPVIRSSWRSVMGAIVVAHGGFCLRGWVESADFWAAGQAGLVGGRAAPL
jgi:hypothetical protein